MDTNYDENLSDNNFLQSLCRDYVDIFEMAVKKSWIICVPRRESYVNEGFTKNDISSHILIPNNSKKNYSTLTGNEIDLKDKFIHLKINEEEKISKLLFEEIFYTDDLSKYTIW